VASMVIAPTGQCDLQIAQPVHFCGCVSSANTLMSPLNCGMDIRSAPCVQSLTQIEHALQMFVLIMGFGHSARFTGTQRFPAQSVIEFFGQALPQTPHSTQRFLLIINCVFFSPVIAKTGHSFAHAVQPQQETSILNAIFFP